MSKRVLLLDDSLVSRALLVPAFHSFGWELVTQEQLGSQGIDALVVDPSSYDFAGLALIAGLLHQVPQHQFPILAILRDERPSLRAMLAETGCLHAVKGRNPPERIAELLETVRRRFPLNPSEAERFSRLIATELSDGRANLLDAEVRTMLLDGLLATFLGQTDPENVIKLAMAYLWQRFTFKAVFAAVANQDGTMHQLLFVSSALKGKDADLKTIIRDADVPGATEVSREIVFLSSDEGISPQSSHTKTHIIQLDLAANGGMIQFQTRIRGERVKKLFDYCAVEIKEFLEVLQNLQRSAHEAERIRVVFSRFLPPEVIEDLLRKKSDSDLLSGEKRRVVALFSHIRDFSYFTEHNAPDRIVTFLNRHFELYASVIKRHGGSINKYIGDAVFALFGAPISYKDNAHRALLAALEIKEKLAALPHLDLDYPACGYQIGIGLNEGPAIIGNIGSSDSFDYTAIGDTINLAARLESLNKHYRTTILLSEGCRQSLEKENAAIPLRQVDCAKVKGKDRSTLFYTVLTTEPEGADGSFLTIWDKGLRMFRIGNWMIAGGYFADCLQRSPEDALSALYVERCQTFMQNPPSDWDGSITLDFK